MDPKDHPLWKHRGAAFAILLAASVLAFYATREPLFAAIGALFIVLLFINDALPEKWTKNDAKKSGIELVIAIALAVGLWLALQLVLQTASPIDVVTSCSMLPAFERGDMIIVRGGEIKAPTIRISGRIEDALNSATVTKSPCTLSLAGAAQAAQCTHAVTVEGQTVAANHSNDVIVFEPQPRIYGLIVHRAFARLDNGTDEWFLTKGDNNLGLDQEAVFQAVPRQDVHGAVTLRLPLLGFLKLFLFGQFSEPPGCKALVTGGN